MISSRPLPTRTSLPVSYWPLKTSSDIKLYPTRPDCFFEYRFFGDACFMRDEAGKIKEIKWKGYGFDFTWVKQ